MFLAGCFPIVQRHGPGRATNLALVEAPGLFLCSFCFPTLQGLRPGWASSLTLAEVPRLFVCRLFAYSAVPYARPGE